MKLGVITDGISRDLEHALTVMKEVGLDHAELQYVWDKEVGDLDDGEVGRVQDLIKAYQVKVSCISRHIFGGLSLGDLNSDDQVYLSHIDSLKRCIEMAKALNSPLVRIMSFRKEMILFGSHGAEEWNVSKGAWDKLINLIELPVQIAEDEKITLVVETGNNAMITSAYLARKLIEAIGSERLRLLWDPCNSLYCNEIPFPNGYQQVGGELISHIHMKDALVDIPKATVECTQLGAGNMKPYLHSIAKALNDDNYQGVISLESVYRPEHGLFEDGFRASLPVFKHLYGDDSGET